MKRRRVPDGIVTSFEPVITPEDFKNIQEKEEKDKQEGEEVKQTRKFVSIFLISILLMFVLDFH